MNLTRVGISSLIFSLAVLAGSESAVAGDRSASIGFSPAVGVRAHVFVRDHDVDVSVVGAQGEYKETLTVETEKKLKINLEDYNFDGHMDFSISHIDDGMGTYEIFQVYVYSGKEKKFVLLTPKCGDEFINVVVSKRTRTLTNSYVLDNRNKTCKMKF